MSRSLREARWHEESASRGWGWSLRMREVTHLPALGQGPLFSLPSPCRCWRCYRKAGIHRVMPLCSPGTGWQTRGPSAARGEAQRGAGQQMGISSTAEHSRARGNNSPSLSSCSVFCLLIPCEERPFAGPASSPAAVRAALPCPTPAGSAVLHCSPADCPLPGSARGSFMCRNVQSSCPSECIVQSRARCCY